MKIDISLGDDVLEALRRAVGTAVYDVVKELDHNIRDMRDELERLAAEATLVRKGFKNAMDPQSYRAFFDEVSTASRLHLDRMRKYLEEMRCAPQTSAATEPTPHTSSDQKVRP